MRSSESVSSYADPHMFLIRLDLHGLIITLQAWSYFGHLVTECTCAGHNMRAQRTFLALLAGAHETLKNSPGRTLI